MIVDIEAKVNTDYLNKYNLSKGQSLRKNLMIILLKQSIRKSINQVKLSESLLEYNKYEYSRCMFKSECSDPIKIYSHISPYMGGPGKIKNTDVAGDAALVALLHDISANCFHKTIVQNSPKHVFKSLTYSSIHKICKYVNRVSYEVLTPKFSKIVERTSHQRR